MLRIASFALVALTALFAAPPAAASWCGFMASFLRGRSVQELLPVVDPRHQERVDAARNEPAPSQKVFRNFGFYLREFKTSAGESVTFGTHRTFLRGRVVYLTQVTVQKTGAASYEGQNRVAAGLRDVNAAIETLKAEAKAAGFSVLVIEGERVTGMRERAQAEDRTYTRVFFLE
jgi:hypothetical protein